MPPHTDPGTRAQIVGLKAFGITTNQIRDATGVCGRTILHIYCRALERGFNPTAPQPLVLMKHVVDAPRSGRPKKQPNEGGGGGEEAKGPIRTGHAKKRKRSGNVEHVASIGREGGMVLQSSADVVGRPGPIDMNIPSDNMRSEPIMSSGNEMFIQTRTTGTGGTNPPPPQPAMSAGTAHAEFEPSAEAFRDTRPHQYITIPPVGTNTPGVARTEHLIPVRTTHAGAALKPVGEEGFQQARPEQAILVGTNAAHGGVRPSEQNISVWTASGGVGLEENVPNKNDTIMKDSKKDVKVDVKAGGQENKDGDEDEDDNDEEDYEEDGDDKGFDEYELEAKLLKRVELPKQLERARP